MKLFKPYKAAFGQKILLLVGVVILSLWGGGVSAQNQNILLSRQDMTVRQAFAEVKKQTGHGFAYSNSKFNANRTIYFSAKTLTLDQVIDQSTAGTEFTYSISYNTISIINAPVKPAKSLPQVVLPNKRGSDIYNPSRPSDYNTKPLHHEHAVVQPESQLVDREIVVEKPSIAEPISYILPIERYAATIRKLPSVGIKTNVLYGAATLTPNLALEIGVGKRSTIELSGSYNGWNRSGNFDSNKKFVHSIFRADYRYWFCERFNGHFIGGGPIFARYNISEYNVPMLFDKKYRYDGMAYGAEAIYGYNFAIGKRWGLELSLGVGVMRLDYDRYDCAVCDRSGTSYKKIYFGPTNASVSLIFLIK